MAKSILQPEQWIKEQEPYDEFEEHDNHTGLDMPEKLYWRPICDNGEPLDRKLKWILRDEKMIDVHLSSKDIGFFRGLKAAGIKDADKIIEALQQYNIIELYEE